MSLEKKQGRYQISNELYHRGGLDWAYSKTDLDYVRLSPANMIAKRALQIDADALRLGRATHARLEFFENEDKYLETVIAEPKVDKRTTAGKEAWAAWESKLALTSKGKIVLGQDEWDEIEDMLAAIKVQPEAYSFLKAKGVNEETFVWQDPDTGVWCKCRPDRYLLEAPKGLPNHIVIDWKTTKSCDLRELSKTVYERRYHVQAALILDGMKQVFGHDVGPFVNGFIEKGFMKRVVCGVIPDADIEIGRRAYKEDLARIAECEKSGIWPGFVDIGLPHWAA